MKFRNLYYQLLCLFVHIKASIQMHSRKCKQLGKRTQFLSEKWCPELAEGVWRVSGGCLESVWMVSGGNWRMSGAVLGIVKTNGLMKPKI